MLFAHRKCSKSPVRQLSSSISSEAGPVLGAGRSVWPDPCPQGADIQWEDRPAPLIFPREVLTMCHGDSEQGVVNSGLDFEIKESFLEEVSLKQALEQVKACQDRSEESAFQNQEWHKHMAV